MSQQDTTNAQVVAAGSKLSAEAQSFVPSRYLNGTSSSASGASSSGATQKLSPQQLSHLPSYITTCYPFVQQNDYPSQQTPRSSTVAWQGPGRPAAGNFTGPRGPAVCQPGYMLGGSRAPHSYSSSSRPARHQQPGFIPRQQYPAAASTSYPAAHGAQNFSIYQFQHRAGPGPGPVSPGPGWPLPGGLPADYSYPQNFFPAGIPLHSVDAIDNNRGRSKERKSSKKKKEATQNNHMVSIGIQNESGVMNGHVPKKKTKTRTIILMDAALQTDFSEEIANLTLAEKPNSLYKARNWKDRYEQDTTTTDSEEVDSDSGYSSPMHRRNQASNGTHPVSIVTYVPGAAGSSQAKPAAPYAFVTATGSAGPSMSYTSYPVPTHTAPYLHFTPAPPTVTVPNTSYQTVESHSTSPTRTKLKGQVVPSCVKTDPEEAGDATSSSGRRRRKRSRRRRRKTADGEDAGALSDAPSELHRAHSSSNVSRTSNDPLDSGLRFEDEEEFPDLIATVSSISAGTTQAAAGLSYSDILKSQPPSNPVMLASSEGCGYVSSSSSKDRKDAPGTPKLSKNARKRQKRREAANRAAEEELAEITIEQQVLKELSAKQIKQSQTSSKKSKQPLALNFADMIDALERQQEQKGGEKATAVSIGGAAPLKEAKKVQKTAVVSNPLDSSAPIKRGKERETPKPKKPSPLKKVILKEREERKRQRLYDEQEVMSPVSSAESQLLPGPANITDSDFSQDVIAYEEDVCGDITGVSSKTSSVDQGTCSTPMSAEMSPISQTSPISMSPLSPGGSPLSSGVTSPIANSIMGERKPHVVMKIHSRRFREYCTQVLDKDIDNSCTQLLQDLVRFQDRLFHKDPTKAKNKRRIVLGLREVTKHLKLKKIKCVIISPNLERIQSKGGLDDALNNILDLCSQQNVPFVFALGRRALGRACAKLVPVSVVGIFNYEGTEENFKRLMDLTEKARSAYDDMVRSLEKEIAENPHKAMTSSGSFPQLFSHLGHSRTPSACSAISFTSSILSEPISENYPYSEPETDSRGYEIIRDSLREGADMMSRYEQEDAEEPDINEDDENMEAEETEEDREGSPSSNNSSKVITIVENLHEIDEGNEADTEDYMEYQTRKLLQQPDAAQPDIDNDDNDTIKDLPHISSIHSSQVDLTAEILSQHSCKTPDLSAEAQSTHSSRTLGDSTPQDLTIVDNTVQPDPNSTTAQKLKTSNKDRIESWVADTQQQMEKLHLQNGADHEASENCESAQQSYNKCSCSKVGLASEECRGSSLKASSSPISWNTCDQTHKHTSSTCQLEEQNS